MIPDRYDFDRDLLATVPTTPEDETKVPVDPTDANDYATWQNSLTEDDRVLVAGWGVAARALSRPAARAAKAIWRWAFPAKKTADQIAKKAEEARQAAQRAAQRQGLDPAEAAAAGDRAAVRTENAMRYENRLHDEMRRVDAREGAQQKDAPPGTDEAVEMAEGAKKIKPEDLIHRKPPRRNINLDFYRDKEAKRIIEFVNKKNKGFADIEARQVETLKETRRLAEKPEVIAAARQKASRYIEGEPDIRLDGPELVALNDSMETQAVKLSALAKKIAAQRAAGGNIDLELVAEFNQRSALFQGTQMAVAGQHAEAGRLLGSLRARATGPIDYDKYLDVLVERGGGLKASIDKAEMLAKIDQPDRAAQFLNRTFKFAEKTGKFLQNVRYNMMLSSVRTHAANIGGSFFSGVYETMGVLPTAIAWNKLGMSFAKAKAGILRGPPPMDENAMYWREWSSAIRGAAASFSDAVKMANGVFRGKEHAITKLYNERGIKIPSELIPESRLGKVLATPSQLLQAEDAFFQTIFKNQKLYQLAVRKAMQDTAGAGDWRRIAMQYLEKPTPAMTAEATEYANKLTYVNDVSAYGKILGGVAKSFQGLQNLPGGRLVMPFVQTPANVTSYAIEATGLGHIIQFRKMIDTISTGTGAQKADLAGRMTMAAGLWYLMYELVDRGTVTGAGLQMGYAQRRAMEAQGWQANSLKIGDKHYPLNRLDPLGMTLGMMASAIEMAQLAPEAPDTSIATMEALLSTAVLLQDRTYVQGITQTMSTLHDGSLKGAMGTSASILSSYFTPNILRDFRMAEDPMRRAMDYDQSWDGFLNRINFQWKNATPSWVPGGGSANLPPRLDWKGDPIMLGGAKYVRAFIPIAITKERQDDASDYLVAGGLGVSKPSPLIKLPGSKHSVHLLRMDPTGWLYYEYQKRIGKAQHKAANVMIKSADFKKSIRNDGYGPDTEAAMALRSTMSKARTAAKNEFVRYIDGLESFSPKVAGKKTGFNVNIDEQFDLTKYKGFVQEQRRARRIGTAIPDAPKALTAPRRPKVPDVNIPQF